MIDKDNTVNLKGNDLQNTDINTGAQMILENYGTPTDLFMPFETLATFSNEYFPKERVIMPTQGQGYQAGLVVNKFQTTGGAVTFEPDLFLQKTKPLNNSGNGGTKAPTCPATVALVLGAAPANVVSEFINSGTGTYNYAVTACNRFGESVPTMATAPVAVITADLNKVVTVTITNSASMVAAPEFYSIYRTEKDGTAMYKIADVPAASVSASGVTSFVDSNETMPNTYTSFMGEFTPEVLTFKQLAPIMKMNLATLVPAIRWMILIYGVPQLFAPKKWMKFKNIKGTPTSIIV